MVTETLRIAPEKTAAPAPLPDVRAAGQHIGIPVMVKPWWGSRRRLFVRVHRNCGCIVMQHWNHDWGEDAWCPDCRKVIPLTQVRRIRANPAEWLCPAGTSSADIKWLEVRGDSVVMWEGRCGARYSQGPRKRYGSEIHLHRQEIELLDVSGGAMLVGISVRSHRLTFLIGRDDGHPFVHVVTKNQKTVAEAYDYMVPVPVFHARMHGFDVKRQGDWFFVPRQYFHGRLQCHGIELTPVPYPANYRGRQDHVPFSNAPLNGTRHTAEVRIMKFPHDLVKGTITAPDHPPLRLDDWHFAIRNIRPPAYPPGGDGFDD